MALEVENPPASAGDIRDLGSVPRSGGPLEEGMASHSRIPAWRIPWTESLAGYSPWGHRESHTTEAT